MMPTESIRKGNVTVKLTSDVSLEDLMMKLPIEVGLRISRKAIKRGADIGNRDYKARLPVVTGNLKRSVRTGGKVIVRKKKGFGKGFVGYVGATRPGGPHAHLVEEGHRVVPRGPAGGPSNEDSKKKPLTGSARVPGKDYLLKTFKATRNRSQKEIIRVLVEGIKDNGG